MMLSFWTDAIVAVLLVATIGYSVLLNRRLSAIRSDRDKFEDLIRNLGTASQRAEAVVAKMRANADDLSQRLDKKIDEARSLSDDLVYMIERGGTIADKMAGLIRNGRDGLQRSEVRPEPRPEPAAEPRVEHRVEAFARRPTRMETPRAVPPRAETYQVEPRSVPPAVERPAAPPQPVRTSTTSRAERELLRALSRRR